MTTFYLVGKIVNTQGLKGELRVLSQTDFPEERFKVGSQLTIFDQKQAVKVVEIDRHRKQKNFDIVHFKGLDHINDVESFKGMTLQVTEENRQDDLEADTFYYDDIIGLSVYDTAEREIGTIRSIMALGANDVWVVQRKDNGKELLLPVIQDVVKQVDLSAQCVVIELLEGLMDE
ncbi:MAG: ribosome maturation factor RimM [Aerococcus sp.]|nr:ribosome maturation factor RimM [Aerococcus sp.]